MFPDLTKTVVGFFIDTVQAKFFKLCSIIILLGVDQFIPGLVTLTTFQISACSPSGGGDVAVCVFDISQPSLAIPFYSVLMSISVFMAFSIVFHSINSPDNSTFSLCSSNFISALLVLSTIYISL